MRNLGLHEFTLACKTKSVDSRYGGGVNCYAGGELNNCILSDNSATFEGGGIYYDYVGTLNHCTITGNSAPVNGGGVYSEFGGILNNCIVWGNAPGNWYVSKGSWTNCCTLPSLRAVELYPPACKPRGQEAACCPL
jgi:predicted outer membrane repeat protein